MATGLTSVDASSLSTAPSADMLLSDAVECGRLLHPARRALCGDAGGFTYGQLADRVERLATILAQLGAAQGERVALLSPNGIAFVEVVLACARIGAAVVPINHRLVGPEVAFQIADSGAVVAVVDPSLKELALSGGLLAKPHLTIGSELDEAIAAAGPFNGARPSAEAVLIQLYTSGTTGRPKGCLLSQRNWLAAATSFANAYDIHAADVVLTALPLFHVASLSWTFATLLAGGTVVVPERFEVDAVWETVAAERVTIAAAPFAVRTALKHPRAGACGATLRMMVGAPSRLAAEVLPAVEMVSGYGATELCGQVTAIRGAEYRAHPAAIGRLMAGCAAAIVDEEGRPVPAGTAGELVVRGANTARGYWNLPEATAELLRGGWLHTGDLVRADADGLIYFVDRLKDMIKTGGENVYSAEVEAVLLAHPGVSEAAVFGVPDERWGQAVKAVVVPRMPPDDPRGFVRELDTWCLERLAPYKQPRWFETAAALPRNATGKVLKPELLAAHDPAATIRLSER